MTPFSDCQASLNSDGLTTLRNYDKHGKNDEEIMIFSRQETQALFMLFSQLEIKNKNFSLPF